MKVSPFSRVQFPDSSRKVAEKTDGEGFSDTLKRQFQDEKKDDQDELDTSDENVGKAIEDFSNDSISREYGLQAEAIGSGPGLRVVLKDGTGAVLRQMSGEEFLRLRDTVTQGTKSGKILDQKL